MKTFAPTIRPLPPRRKPLGEDASSTKIRERNGTRGKAPRFERRPRGEKASSVRRRRASAKNEPRRPRRFFIDNLPDFEREASFFWAKMALQTRFSSWESCKDQIFEPNEKTGDSRRRAVLALSLRPSQTVNRRERPSAPAFDKTPTIREIAPRRPTRP